VRVDESNKVDAELSDRRVILEVMWVDLEQLGFLLHAVRADLVGQPFEGSSGDLDRFPDRLRSCAVALNEFPFGRELVARRELPAADRIPKLIGNLSIRRPGIGGI